MKVKDLVRNLRAYARSKSLRFEVVKSRGKGSHQMLYLGSRKTTILAPNKELKVGTLKAILRRLGVEDDFTF